MAKRVARRKRSPTRAELDVALQRFADLFRAWGREGGKKGAKARWENVSPEQRRAHAKKAAAARWKKRPK
jgi:hypothetical protein